DLGPHFHLDVAEDGLSHMTRRTIAPSNLLAAGRIFQGALKESQWGSHPLPQAPAIKRHAAVRFSVPRAERDGVIVKIPNCGAMGGPLGFATGQIAPRSAELFHPLVQPSDAAE